jgi:hypothetical protein
MVSRIRLSRAVALFAAVVLAGCASAPAAEGEAGATAPAAGHQVTVHNDHTSWLEATIFILPDAGAVQTMLGTVPPGESRTFTYTGERGWHRLIARRNTGDLSSEQFTMPDNSRLEWRTSQPRVQVRSR